MSETITSNSIPGCAAWKAARNFKTYRGRALVSHKKKGVDVGIVYSDYITEYVSKDAWQLSWKRDERLFYVHRKGLIALSPSEPHEMF